MNVRLKLEIHGGWETSRHHGTRPHGWMVVDAHETSYECCRYKEHTKNVCECNARVNTVSIFRISHQSLFSSCMGSQQDMCGLRSLHEVAVVDLANTCLCNPHGRLRHDACWLEREAFPKCELKPCAQCNTNPA